MTPRPIVGSVLPFRRAGLLGSALLAAVVATALLSAGQARANLEPDDVVDCQALGPGTCLPVDPQPLADPFFWTSTGTGNDVLFTITSDPTQIILTIQDQADATNLTGAGFQLTGIEPLPDMLIEIANVEFIGGDNADWTSLPTANPFVINTGLPGNMATIEWTDLAGADFSSAQPGGARARINLNFVPEPGTAALMGLGLAGLGVARRSRREESEAAA